MIGFEDTVSSSSRRVDVQSLIEQLDMEVSHPCVFLDDLENMSRKQAKMSPSVSKEKDWDTDTIKCV
jgi:hypothetical protein